MEGMDKAIRKEMAGFNDNEVFLRTKRNDLHPNQKIIPNKEIYSKKYKYGKLSRVKYRHAARGDK